MYYSSIVLASLIGLYLVYIAVRASLILYQTGVKLKLPLLIGNWLIFITFVADDMLTAIVFYKHNFSDQQFDKFFFARTISVTTHQTLIYVALLLVVFHTWNLNRKTIRLLSLLELKKIALM